MHVQWAARGAGSGRSSLGSNTETAAGSWAAVYFAERAFSLPGQIFLALKGNLWSKVSRKAAESFDSQWTGSRGTGQRTRDGASRWADLPPRATWAHPPGAPAPRCLGPKSPFSTGIAKANSRRYLLGVMLSITLI